MVERTNWVNPKWQDRINKLMLASTMTCAAIFGGHFAQADVKDGMAQFHTSHVEGKRDEMRFYSSAGYKSFVESASDKEMQTSGHFKKIFLEELAKDPYMKNLPFTVKQVEQLLNGLTVRIADICESENMEGFYLDKRSLIVLDAQQDCKEFAKTALHEIAHALGAGEGMANLFAEEFLGITEKSERASYRDPLYNSGFERTLLNRTDPKTFWKAAFASDQEFGKLWDKHIPELCYADLVKLRDADKYRKDIGYKSERLEKYFSEIIIEWVVCMHNPELEEAKKKMQEKVHENLEMIDYLLRDRKTDKDRARSVFGEGGKARITRHDDLMER